MYGMFYNATSFNQCLDTWDVSLSTDITNMFEGAISYRFNKNLLIR